LKEDGLAGASSADQHVVVAVPSWAALQPEEDLVVDGGPPGKPGWFDAVAGVERVVRRVRHNWPSASLDLAV
jgi:hypothetical protein